MIHVTDRSLGQYAGHLKGLKLQIGHGPRRVLRERLVDPDAHLPARLRRPGHQVLGQDLLNQRLWHVCSVLLCSRHRKADSLAYSPSADKRVARGAPSVRPGSAAGNSTYSRSLRSAAASSTRGGPTVVCLG